MCGDMAGSGVSLTDILMGYGFRDFVVRCAGVFTRYVPVAFGHVFKRALVLSTKPFVTVSLVEPGRQMPRASVVATGFESSSAKWRWIFRAMIR